MKYFLLLAAILQYSYTQAQLNNWQDDIYYSGTYAVAIRDISIGKQTVHAREEIILVNDNDTINIDISKPAGGKIAISGIVDGTDNCLPAKAPVYIEFVNNETANFQSNTDENCTGNMRAYLGGKWKNKNVLNMLQHNLVRKISIGGTDDNHYFFLTREEAVELRRTINCVLYLQD